MILGLRGVILGLRGVILGLRGVILGLKEPYWGLRSLGEGGTDGRTYVTAHPCVLQDIGPLGPLPKKGTDGPTDRPTDRHSGL